jgi:His/Glu/Gln/Arg/opine family amino acid ABC transporter permease subunit
MLDFSLMLSSVPRLCESLPVTLELFFTVVVAGLIIGVGLAFISTLQSRVVNSLIAGYIAIFRGTPALVQLFFVYYGLGQFDFVRESFIWPFFRSPFPCAVIALGMNSGAYTANILIGALSAVPKGLVEGAQALGLSKTSTLLRIEAPLAVRIAMPAYANETILNLKATSLASTVTIMELTGTSRLLVSDTYAPYEIFLTAGFIYLIMTYIVAYIFRGIERYIDRTTGRTFVKEAKLDKTKVPVILENTSN